MAKIGFEAPPTVGEMLGMLNETGRFRLSVIANDGAVLGHLNTAFGRTHVSPYTPAYNQTGQVLLISGELDDDARPLFIGESDELVATFVYGVFLGAFGGRSLEAIQDELTRRPERFI